MKKKFLILLLPIILLGAGCEIDGQKKYSDIEREMVKKECGEYDIYFVENNFCKRTPKNEIMCLEKGGVPIKSFWTGVLKSCSGI